MCIYCQFRSEEKSATLAFKQTIIILLIISLNMSIKTIINKNGNKIFRKKIFQLLLNIFIKYVYQVCLLKQLLIKMGIKFFEKKYSIFLLIILLIISLSMLLYISIKTIINKNGNNIFRK